MRSVIAIVLIAAASVVAADEITADQVIIAHQMGAAPEGIVSRLVDPANSVVAPTLAELERMRAEGVPDAVVLVMMENVRPAAAMSLPVAPTAVASAPDNPRLLEVVRLVQSGMSEKLIEEQIRSTGVSVKPTVNDLIYLKENQVSEGIIAALMTAPVIGGVATPAPALTATTEKPTVAPAAEEGVSIEGLVIAGGRVSFRRDRPGRLVLGADTIEWIDASDQGKSFEIFVTGIQRVEARCYARSDGEFCHEVKIELAKGADFTFQDAARDFGGNESIVRLLQALGSQYPNLAVKKKIKK